MTLARAGLPVRLMVPPIPTGTARRRARPRPLRYAYVLIDLTNTDHGENAFFRSLERNADINERVSDEITWRAALRTNGAGYLVDPSSQLGGAQREDLPHDVLDDPERCPPLALALGMEFNLWWGLRLEDYQAAREGRTCRRERQLERVSTYFAGSSRDWAARVTRLAFPELPPEQARRRADELLVRDSATEYRRGLLRAERDVGFFLTLRDRVLDEALALKERIHRVIGATTAYDVAGHLGMLERVERIFQHYERGERDWRDDVNSVIPDAMRAGRSEYRGVASELSQLPGAATQIVQELGRRLSAIHADAVHAARWHYDAEAALAAAASISEAAGIALLPQLRELIRAPELSPRYQQVLRGEEPPQDTTDPVERFLATTKTVAGWADNSVSVIQQTTSFIEACLREAVREGGEIDLARARRLVELMNAYERDPMPSTALDTFEATVELADGQGATRRLRMRFVGLQRTGRVLARIGEGLKLINFLFAWQTAHDDPTVRNWMGAVRDTASLCEGITAAIGRAAGVSTERAEGVLGMVGLALAVMDMGDALADGDRIAAIGHMISACGGFLPLLYGGGPAGIVAAVLVVAGAAIVALSMSEDARWVHEHFDAAHNSGNASDAARGAIRRFDECMSANAVTPSVDRRLETWGYTVSAS